MERRRFIQRLVETAVLGGLLFLGGCSQEKKPIRVGNQDRLWQIATGQQNAQEPIDLAYTKDTPAFYRDASMGKADPSFVPAVGGG